MARLIKLPIAVIEALEDLADRRGQTLEETIQHAANTEVYMDEQLVRGNEILCREPSGKVWRVVFSHMK
jgi:hypothetical protein